MLIYKEKLPIDTLDVTHIKLKGKSIAEAKKSILKVDMQYGVPTMWYDITSADADLTDYRIIAIGTGHYWEGLPRDQYIGSLVLHDGELVLHYFLMESNKKGGSADETLLLAFHVFGRSLQGALA